MKSQEVKVLTTIFVGALMRRHIHIDEVGGI